MLAIFWNLKWRLTLKVPRICIIMVKNIQLCNSEISIRCFSCHVFHTIIMKKKMKKIPPRCMSNIFIVCQKKKKLRFPNVKTTRTTTTDIHHATIMKVIHRHFELDGEKRNLVLMLPKAKLHISATKIK